MTTWPRLLGLAIGVSVVGVCARAEAAPQASAGLTVGGGIEGLRGGGTSGFFHVGGRADVLFLREHGRDMAIGPYVELMTASFDTLEIGGGMEWLVPVDQDLPFILSAGLFERRAPLFGWEPGVATTLFFGSRSFNFHSWYNLGLGLFVQGRYGLGDSKQGEVIFGAQLDLALLAYPVVFLYEAIRR